MVGTQRVTERDLRGGGHNRPRAVGDALRRVLDRYRPGRTTGLGRRDLYRIMIGLDHPDCGDYVNRLTSSSSS